MEAGHSAPRPKHNEVAPAQHELAPVFSTTNIATDHNQLTMEMMQKHCQDVMAWSCLLHEKPFAGVNGSGKHNNWSISTDTGVNLLEPGRNAFMKTRSFYCSCAAVIKAVDEYQDLLRVICGNVQETIIVWAPMKRRRPLSSMFLGDELHGDPGGHRTGRRL